MVYEMGQKHRFNFFKTRSVAILCGRENVYLSAEGKLSA